MTKHSYKIVGEIFAQHENAEMRDQCLSNGTFERFIERLGQLSSEKKRVKVDHSAAKKTEASKESEISKGDKMMEKKKKKENKKDQKRKGVGYTTGVGVTWNVAEYIKSKEAKS
jgi:hypothetical protein